MLSGKDGVVVEVASRVLNFNQEDEEDKDIEERDFFPPDPIIPSSTTDKPWIYAYSPDYDTISLQNEDEFPCGKWMIFNDCLELSPSRGMTRHDYAWQFIKKLVENNSSSVSGLISANCSTAWKPSTTAWVNEYMADPSDPRGVICCFTKDSSDKNLAKKAADAIRQVYHYPSNMFYKSDRDTMAMKFRILGYKFVSIYKHNISNHMFERDPVTPYKWNLVPLKRVLEAQD